MCVCIFHEHISLPAGALHFTHGRHSEAGMRATHYSTFHAVTFYAANPSGPEQHTQQSAGGGHVDKINIYVYTQSRAHEEPMVIARTQKHAFATRQTCYALVPVSNCIYVFTVYLELNNATPTATSSYRPTPQNSRENHVQRLLNHTTL